MNLNDLDLNYISANILKCYSSNYLNKKNLGNQSSSTITADFTDRMRNLTCTKKLKTEKNIS